MLILSFLNNDLLKTTNTVNESLCAGIANKDACEDTLERISRQGFGVFDISGEEYKYNITATGESNIERRLVVAAQSIIQKEWDDNSSVHMSYDRDDRSKSCDSWCAEQSNPGNCSVGGCERAKKYDINRDGLFNEEDTGLFLGLDLLDILNLLCNVTDVSNGGRCRWNQLKELIQKDMDIQVADKYGDEKYEECKNKGLVEPLYVLRENDDIGPSCAARCIYAPLWERGALPDNNKTCPERLSIKNNPKKYTSENNSEIGISCDWGFGESDENDYPQIDDSPLRLEDYDRTDGTKICKIGHGVHDQDFKKDTQGYNRALCASQYVIGFVCCPVGRRF